MNNYRVDLFCQDSKMTHYKIEFPERWLAKAFADAVKDDTAIKSVYLLERMSDGKFDVVNVIANKSQVK